MLRILAFDESLSAQGFEDCQNAIRLDFGRFT